MGTNYYAKVWYFGHQVPYHIGKQSVGWAFCFATQDFLEENTIWEWFAHLNSWEDRVTIEDEYGRELCADQLFRMIKTNKHKQTPFTCQDKWPGKSKWQESQHIDEYGYWFNLCKGDWC